MNNRKWKYLFIFIIFLILIYTFSGSYTANSMDNLAYVVAIGIDASENDKMKVSFQFIPNSAMTTEGGSSDDSEPIVNTVESSSIETAINLMNVYIGKELNLAHCKVIVFSEEFAKNGVSTTIYTLTNNTELRPSTNIIISRCDADYYIKNSKPSLETLVTRYYDIFPNSSKYTGYTANVTIGDFYNRILCDTCQCTAILGGTNSNNNSANTKNDSDIISDESSISGKRETENIGLAIFNGDKLVGELNAIETLCHLINTNDVSTFILSVPNPNDETQMLDISMSHKRKDKVYVDTSSGTPYISLNIKLTGKILTVTSDSNYIDENNLKSIGNYTNSYLESTISNYLYKTSKEFKSDIDSFGRYAIRKFLTEDDWNNYDWFNKYKDAFFNVTVDADIKSSHLLTES